MEERSETDRVFKALASRTRRHMLDIVRDRPGIGVGELAAGFDVSRIGIMKHLAVVEDAGLITSVREGRSRRLFFNAVPIQAIYERWTNEYSGFFTSQVTELKRRAERRARRGKS